MYAMSAVKLPSRWCRDLDSLASKFMWGKAQSGRSFLLISWPKICKAKEEGGLGIRKCTDMNISLLCKLGWHMAIDSKKVWVQALKSKYLAGTNFWNCRKRKHSSWTWNSILLTRNVIRKGICYRVGRGDNINI